MAQAPRQFAKPPKTPQGLIALLESRGLVITNPAICEQAIRKIGYYRLSAYMLPFQVGGDVVNRHDFGPGVGFDDILDLYVFDRKLRLLVLDAMERIEVAFRAAITDSLAVAHGPHWYLVSSFFEPRFDHAAYLDDIRREIGHVDEKRRTVAIQHYYQRYDEPEMPPSWMVFEALPFGKIANTIRNLKLSERNRISRAIGLPEPVLRSWCGSLNYLRNLAAHHQRLWNRDYTLKPLQANQYAVDLARNNTCYAQLVTLQVLLKGVSPGSEWAQRLADLFAAHPKVTPPRLGFPADWERRPLWRLARPSPVPDGSHHVTVRIRGRGAHAAGAHASDGCGSAPQET